MAKVKWIKLDTEMFNNRKIKYIRSLPDGDQILLIWIMLLTSAGNCNAGGYIFLTENIPYSPEMLAEEYDVQINTIKLALQTFSKLEMVELDDKGIYITGWEQHQSTGKLEDIREYNRIAKQKSREKQKLLLEGIDVNDNVNDSQLKSQMCHDIDIDIELDKDIDKEEDIDKDIDNINYKLILETWNQLPEPIKTLRSITVNRKKKIKAKITQLNLTTDDVIEAINKIKDSDFLRGYNNRNWVIEFDWLFKNTDNFTKVLEGNYDNKGGGVNANNNSSARKELEDGIGI